MSGQYSQRLSAGAVVMCEPNPTNLLMLRAYRNWDFPKGLVESGETPLQGAIREVHEETGLADLQFPWGEVHFETLPYNRGKVARYYLAVSQGEDVHLPINPQLGQPEHHEFRWVTLAQANQLASARVKEVLAWAESVINAT